MADSAEVWFDAQDDADVSARGIADGQEADSAELLFEAQDNDVSVRGLADGQEGDGQEGDGEEADGQEAAAAAGLQDNEPEPLASGWIQIFSNTIKPEPEYDIDSTDPDIYVATYLVNGVDKKLAMDKRRHRFYGWPWVGHHFLVREGDIWLNCRVAYWNKKLRRYLVDFEDNEGRGNVFQYWDGKALSRENVLWNPFY